MDIGNVKHMLVLDPQVVAEYLGEPFERFGDTIVLLKRYAVDEAKHTLTRLSNIVSWPETLLDLQERAFDMTDWPVVYT